MIRTSTNPANAWPSCVAASGWSTTPAPPLALRFPLPPLLRNRRVVFGVHSPQLVASHVDRPHSSPRPPGHFLRRQRPHQFVFLRHPRPVSVVLAGDAQPLALQPHGQRRPVDL